MKRVLFNVGMLALATAVSSTVAFAGTCAAPDNLPSNATTNGTTCGGVVGINMGGAIYGHPSNVYSFTYNPDPDTGTEPDLIALAGATRELTVVASCNDDGTMGPAGLAIATGGGEVEVGVDTSNLVAGTEYFVVVSTDPSIPPNPNDPVCGDFVINADDLPVELQTFSVD